MMDKVLVDSLLNKNLLLEYKNSDIKKLIKELREIRKGLINQNKDLRWLNDYKEENYPHAFYINKRLIDFIDWLIDKRLNKYDTKN